MRGNDPEKTGLNDRFDERLEFLRRHGADAIGHSERSLLAHLLGIRALLMSWGAGAHLLDAGLFHSVYGTESFRRPAIPDSDRSRVRDLIGDKAERLVWLYCRVQRGHFEREAGRGTPDHIVDHACGKPIAIAPSEVAAIANLLAADALEQLPRHPLRNRKRAENYSRMRRHLLPGAVSALAKVRNAALAWRLIAIALATGSVLVPWFGISGDSRLVGWPLTAREAAIGCGLFVFCAIVVFAQPHRTRLWFALFGFAPLGLLLSGMLLSGWESFAPTPILSALLLGLGAAASGTAVGRKGASFRARHAARPGQAGFADEPRSLDSDFETQ